MKTIAALILLGMGASVPGPIPHATGFRGGHRRWIKIQITHPISGERASRKKNQILWSHG